MKGVNARCSQPASILFSQLHGHADMLGTIQQCLEKAFQMKLSIQGYQIYINIFFIPRRYIFNVKTVYMYVAIGNSFRLRFRFDEDVPGHNRRILSCAQHLGQIIRCDKQNSIQASSFDINIWNWILQRTCYLRNRHLV